MTNIVIPHRNDYPHTELIYALRCIEQKVRDLGTVIIAGDLPRIVKNVGHVYVKDEAGYQRASRNIYRKLLAAADVCERFLMWHDDHYVLTDIKNGDFPYYHRGPINPEGKTLGYATLLRNTLERFPQANDFDVHCPILMTKEGLKKLEVLDWEKPYGYGIKTAYCVLNGIDGEQTTDLKIKEPWGRDEIHKAIAYRDFFSTQSTAFQGKMQRVLKELYPQESRFVQLKTMV